MNKLFCLSNPSPLRILLSNSVIQKCIVNSLEKKLHTCKNCEILRKGLSSKSYGSWNIVFKPHICRLGSYHSHTLRREIKAAGQILSRSGFHSNKDIASLLGIGRRTFSTSQTRFNQRNEKENEDEKKKKKEEETMGRLFIGCLVASTLTMTSFMLFRTWQDLTSPQPRSAPDASLLRFISWDEFYDEMLLKGEVETIIIKPKQELAIIRLHYGAVIKGKQSQIYRNLFFKMKISDPIEFERKVRMCEEQLGIKPEDQIPILDIHKSFSATDALVILPGIILFVLLLPRLTKRIKMSDMPSPTDMFSDVKKARFVRVDILSQQGKGISFKEVAGLKEAKQEIIEFVDYLKSPDRFKELGAKLPRGALLLGPPGCGKTLLAKAVATEAKVPFLAMAGSEFVEMIGGLGAARVRDLFKEAKKRAPCIVYIDEIDAVGKKRSGGNVGGVNSEGEQTLNQLLVEMDGMGTQEGVIMLASTNRADILDKALLRPGRFDRHITIDLPTFVERQELFDLYLKNLTLQNKPESLSYRLAQLTPGMSGADIANVCNEAAIHAAREGKKVIVGSDFDYSLERIIAGSEKKSGLMAPNEKKVVAYHESGHALVGWLLEHTDALLRISIVPRTNSMLGFAQYRPSDQKLYSEEELFERMCMALGGRAAEAVIFNHVTTGAQDDLKKVTQMAYDQVRSFGMNKVVGPISFPRQGEEPGPKPFSRKLAAIIDEQVQILVSRAYRQTEGILQKNTDKLHLMAKKLLEKEVLTYDEVEVLIGPPPHGVKDKIEPHGWEGIMPSNDNNNKPKKI
ncbi:paraplegin [Patella vulgata]|uniref:paraplegin n=1 Tax=Patella vulgata TaxID=6465 RepID=UPI00217FC287|nr:paraplegin [Patella vulgata]